MVCGRPRQGDSIGSHKYCLGMLKFFQRLASELQPHTAFNHQSAGVPFSAIIDDVTLVPRRRHVLTVLDFILQEAPKHGQVPNLGKTVVWLHKGSLRSDLARQLIRRGVKVSINGLDRLLGAPVGGTDWITKDDGHLAHITAKAIHLTKCISTIKHPQCVTVSIFCYGIAPVILCIILAGLSLRGWHKASHPNTMKLYLKGLDEFCLLKNFPLSSRPD